jgi:hypothetical protein
MCRAVNALGSDETKCNVLVEGLLKFFLLLKFSESSLIYSILFIFTDEIECKYKKPTALIQELEHSTKDSIRKRISLDVSNARRINIFHFFIRIYLFFYLFIGFNFVAKTVRNDSPKFNAKLPGYKLVRMGDSITIKGSFTGFPYPKVQWLKNGEVISD